MKTIFNMLEHRARQSGEQLSFLIIAILVTRQYMAGSKLDISPFFSPDATA